MNVIIPRGQIYDGLNAFSSTLSLTTQCHAITTTMINILDYYSYCRLGLHLGLDFDYGHRQGHDTSLNIILVPFEATK